MPTPRVSAARRTGQFFTGLGALAVLVAVLAGGPIALLAFAGNPLPDHVPTLSEIGTTLTSRDDGQLFLRALALLGWAGWATFALSVLVELPARMIGRPAIRLPGLSRQQRAAAALVGSVALILVASPAATAASTMTAPHYAPPAAPAVSAPAVARPAPPATAVRAPHWLVNQASNNTEPADPVYRVERGDYLGHIADRYLGDFDQYPELAKLNKIRNPDRIQPGQLLKMPADARDHGLRPHATGLVRVPPPPPPPADQDRAGRPGADAAEPTAPPESPAPPVRPPSDDDGRTAGDGRTTYASGAARSGDPGEMNRPLAVSAVIAAASIIGAQIGAVLGLRRQSVGQSGEIEVGRHRNRFRRPRG
ncbi:LysM domain-containing protein [Solwaraspora sp. WMMD1047]|uniref:LysM peptidoglycan-binding domain-containing protein n=1 Tax=Solwaraspora sp. WMMD1047 TaxID=3016102 RepID=UPI002416773C|nr:LysM domain-containing protein [Solwaraspora sp. WMMD1047]MDG4827832.1 LysM domain-containing protein [Solwaraspora sp. WMMD1047]